MADEAVVESQTPPAAPAAPGGDPSAPKPPASPNPAPAPNNSGWEAERKAFIADLQKERKARQDFEKQVAAHKAELETERRRVQALSGVTPRSPEEAEAEEIRSKFKQVIPRDYLLKMLDLSEDDLKALKGSKSREEQLAALETQHWQRHGREMQAEFHKALAAELGGEKLSERQLRKVVVAFSQACDEDPKMLQRYEAGDTAVIKEFAQEWAEDWFKPVARKTQAAEVGRSRPLPNGRDRSVTTPAGQKIDVNDPKAVEDLLVAGFRERGGQFGR